MTEIMDNLSNIDDSRMVQTLLFDDQLTITRARGAITLRDDDISASHQLEGMFHV